MIPYADYETYILKITKQDDAWFERFERCCWGGRTKEGYKVLHNAYDTDYNTFLLLNSNTGEIEGGKSKLINNNIIINALLTRKQPCINDL